jgi:hypothetical protein
MLLTCSEIVKKKGPKILNKLRNQEMYINKCLNNLYKFFLMVMVFVLVYSLF